MPVSQFGVGETVGEEERWIIIFFMKIYFEYLHGLPVVVILYIR